MHDELQEDLRTTSIQVSATAEALAALEAEKRTLAARDPQDPRVIELSDEIERLAGRLRRQSAIEGDLTREIHEATAGKPA